MKINKNVFHRLSIFFILTLLVFPVDHKSADANEQFIDSSGSSITPELPKSAPNVPEGETYVEINNNIPYFTNKDITATKTWVEFSQLDDLGRVGAANAVLSVDTLPAEQESRKDISAIHPTGWHQGKYKQIGSGGWLYNRSHLIGHQLIGEGVPELNLMTGTRWFNMDGMLPFENFVASTIENDLLTVRYRVTPFFEDGNLLASGAFMEGFSIDDNGETLQFNIYIPNRQKNVQLDYGTGQHDGEYIEQTAMAAPVNKEHPGTTLYFTGNAIVNSSSSNQPVDSDATEGQGEVEPAGFAEVATETPAEEYVSYKNCTAVREAGAAPIHRGEPGYASHLDRDNDGIGCE
ncbi:DNA/RNA non-specific endonuclease [Ruoffia tabacinasalis]|uniref:DNA/RNA non-specific endonuclease n=1 Tax=Ruoffia tabacinasalis TaxID=87458 RepID=A0ABS0LGK3_9LACT|nr:DNA/RNA non-specific endonuclease [Ruoffia tabacinasalis]MBG9977391.1 DNA/RNA non-specific endonuclease [Ruoffia tabacinasalis]